MKLAHVAFILLLLGACSSAEAHTFEAPDTVIALPGGAFHYSWVFTAVADTAFLGAEGWSGIINTPPGAMGECFCTCRVPPGEQFHFDVSGSLTNPALAGKIQNWIDECFNFTFASYTVILPSRRLDRIAFRNDVVAADQDQRGGSVERGATRSTSWGAVKAKFRGPRMAPFPF